MFSVRNAVHSDVEVVYQLICELEDESLDKAIFSKFFIENISSENNIYLMACNHLQPVGFLSCHGQKLLHHAGMVYEIQELIVTEKFRNKGIGEMLLKQLESILSLKNNSSLEVSSNIRRKDAHRFYLKNGFSQTHFKFKKS